MTSTIIMNDRCPDCNTPAQIDDIDRIIESEQGASVAGVAEVQCIECTKVYELALSGLALCGAYHKRPDLTP